MDLIEYINLSEEEQWDTFYESSSQLATANNIEYDYVLFSVESFYVELVFDKIKGSCLYQKAFKSGKRLDKYFPEVLF